MVLFHLRLLLRLKAGGGNLIGLKAEQVELLRVGLLVHHQCRFLRFEGGAAANQPGEHLAVRIQPAKGIEDRELASRVQQRLMFVRAVDIHQPLTQCGENVQSSGRAVNELTVGAGAGETTLEDKLMVFAWLQPILFQKRLERGPEPRDVKHRLDGAALAATTDKVAIRAFPQCQVQRPDEDGLTGPCFARNDVIARLQLKRQLNHKGEVLDAESRQHVTVMARNLTIMRAIGKRKVA